MDEKSLNAAHSEGWNYYEKKEYAKAVEIWKELALKGHTLAQNNLAICYERGLGVEKDLVAATNLYKQAAENGDKVAQNNLAICYERGQGIEQSYKLAAKWYKKSARQGYEKAKTNLDDLFSTCPDKSVFNLECEHCFKPIGEGEARVFLSLREALCLDCYKELIVKKQASLEGLRKKVNKSNLFLLIFTLVGFAVGLTLFLTVGRKMPTGWSVFILIYSTLGLGNLVLFLGSVFGLFYDDKPKDPDPIVILLFILCVLFSVLAAPFYALHKARKNLTSLVRLGQMKTECQQIIDTLQGIQPAKEGERAVCLEAYPGKLSYYEDIKKAYS